MTAPALADDPPAIGNHAGWLLTFHRERDGRVDEEPALAIGTADYHAEIRASLPGDLSGGGYSFVVEGMTDRHYGVLKGGSPPSVVRLHLFWHDTNETLGGYVTNLAGLTDLVGLRARHGSGGSAAVAELNITRVTRRAGTRRYEAVIEARERVFDLLAKYRVPTPIWAIGPLATAVQLADAVKVPVRCHVDGREQPKQTITGQVGPNPLPGGSHVGETGVQSLRELGERMEQSAGRFGRGMYLVRTGELHIGQRAVPLDGTVKHLSVYNGLVAARAERDLSVAADDSGRGPRRQFTLVLKGRPDLRPGDVVEFEPPADEVPATTLPTVPAPAPFAALAQLAEPTPAKPDPVRLYVSGVLHELGRTSGFRTTVTGVELRPNQSDWDGPPRGTNPATPGPTHPGPEQRAARTVAAHIAAVVQARRHTEVAEVRRSTATNRPGDGPPGQTTSLWWGLTVPDGRPGAAARLPIDRSRRAELAAVPYATPFAWGRCGLVVPRYPGTRVLVGHRNGAGDDPVDLGAIWESGHGPDAEPGDWWLSTPAGVDAGRRTALGDEEVAAEHTGAVANDLTDADGVRIIEVGQLIVRVGDDKHRVAGRRPVPADTAARSVTIEHTETDASIVIRPDGSIEIRGAKLILDAGTKGSIELRANSVDVACTTMNVH